MYLWANKKKELRRVLAGGRELSILHSDGNWGLIKYCGEEIQIANVANIVMLRNGRMKNRLQEGQKGHRLLGQAGGETRGV